MLLLLVLRRPLNILALFLVYLTMESSALVIQQEKSGVSTAIESSKLSEEIESLVSSAVSRSGRASTSTTITLFRTTTVSSVMTTTITTRRTCAVLGFFTSAALSPVTVFPGGFTTTPYFVSAPASACRRKRHFKENEVFVAIKDDNLGVQFHRLNPSQTLNFETTALPQFRNQQPEVNDDVLLPLPRLIEPSFDKTTDNLRVADPFIFGNALSSLVSSLVANALTSTSTFTSTISSFTSTSTSTSFSATTTYYVIGSCYPSGISIC